MVLVVAADRGFRMPDFCFFSGTGVKLGALSITKGGKRSGLSLFAFFGVLITVVGVFFTFVLEAWGVEFFLISLIMVAGFGSSILIGAGVKFAFFSRFGECAGACVLSTAFNSDGVTGSVGAGVSTVNWFGICSG